LLEVAASCRRGYLQQVAASTREATRGNLQVLAAGRREATRGYFQEVPVGLCWCELVLGPAGTSSKYLQVPTSDHNGYLLQVPASTRGSPKQLAGTSRYLPRVPGQLAPLTPPPPTFRRSSRGGGVGGGSGGQEGISFRISYRESPDPKKKVGCLELLS